MGELDEWPEIEMSPATVKALRSRGGNLYIWVDRAGLLRVRAKPPVELVVFEKVSSRGCSIHIDREIAPARRWGIGWRRLPWPHFIAVPNPIKRNFINTILDAPWP